MDEKIFGTPPEPLFNHKLCEANPSLLGDWLDLLTNKNTVAIETATPEQGASFTNDSVEFLFFTCEKLKMPPEVKYLSLELFDRFMLRHIQDLHEHILKNSSRKSRGSEWTELKKRVKKQVVLRMVSCIQIASKLTSHYKVLTPFKAKKCLQEAGHKYNTEGIMQSELRILKTLNFIVSVPSPLLYLETVLELLGEHDLDLQVKVIHGVSQQLLDLVYLNYTDIYDRLHLSVAKGSPITDKDKAIFSSVRADKMLLIVSVVTAATYIVNQQGYEKVMEALNKITKIPVEDVSDLATVIIQLILESRED